MSQWYVKELSKLTNVSVQTLHHYDRIDLLKPSVRLPNGYRLYSEKDLLKLQQIIALKFFGFELTQIKNLLNPNGDTLNQLIQQADFLAEKSKNLLEASNVLQAIITDCKSNKSIPWETIIKVIEVYRMTEKLEHAWAKKIFTNEELKEFVEFENEVKTKISNAEQKANEAEWNAIVKEIEANLEKNPDSEVGIQIGKRCMVWVNKVYGDRVKLRNAIWEKGFKTGTKEIDPDLSQEGVAWLDKAMEAYYTDRAKTIFLQIGKKNDEEILKQWEEMLKDMCGNDAAARQETINFVMNNPAIPQATKDWLKKFN